MATKSGSQNTLPAHHKAGGGGFVNPWPSFTNHGFFSFFGLMFHDWNRARGVPPPIEQRVPVIKPNWEKINAASEGKCDNELLITWLGHASMLIQLEGVNILADPIFSKRCSASQSVGPARFTEAPCQVDELPRIDAVVISHNHYDHLDLNTVKAIGNDAHFYVPLGNKTWFESSGLTNVTECDWWDEHEFTKSDGRAVKIVCTPSQHFTGRGIHDRFKTLWSSWVIKGKRTGASCYFAGDTGYRYVAKGADRDSVPTCPAFKEIGAKFGPFDVSCLPIGAYSPRWFMSPIHCDPEDAVCLHQELKSKQSVGMHWGTFILTDEDPTEPPVRVRAEMQKRGLDPETFKTINIGESLVVKIGAVEVI